MKNSIKFGALLLGMLLIPVMQSFMVAKPALQSIVETVDSMTLTVIGDGVKELSWSPIEGDDPYLVTVTDLTTNTLHSEFYTYNTSAIISNLISGHHYRYGLAKQKAMQNLQE